MHADGRDLVGRAAAALRAEGAQEVYLFGSGAEGRAGPSSDLDFAVVGLPDERFYAAAARASQEAGVLIDLVSLDEDTPFVRALKAYGTLRRVA